MKRSEVLIFANAFQRLILNGQIEEAAEYCVRPLVLYFPDTVLVLKHRADLEAQLKQKHLHYMASGTQRIEATDLDIRDCTDNRAFVSVQFTHILDDGSSLQSSPTSYVLRRSDTPTALLLELADISEPHRPRNSHDPSRNSARKFRVL